MKKLVLEKKKEQVNKLRNDLYAMKKSVLKKAKK
jgi:hypothetical protein